MKPFFYDNVNTGHHPAYIAGIVEAAERVGTPFVVGSAERPPTLLTQSWIPVEETGPRQLMATRRQLRMAARRAREMGADVLVDLYLDKQIWAAGAARPGLAESIHVLHHAEQYSPDRRGGAAIRTAYLRRTLRGLARRGAPIIVHTRRAAELVSDLVPKDLIIMAGYPVVPLPERTRDAPSTPTRLLFVGAGREEKGLDLLLDALSTLPADSAILRVVGRQPENLRSALTSRFPSAPVEWVDDYVDYATLISEYQSADLAILPYRTVFSRHGGPSSVLLETLSAGLPVVTTTALADQLPPDYTGAKVANADSAGGLAECLGAALANLSALIASANRKGPEFIATHHSYDAYLKHLLSAVAMVR
jgi:glycosyltransferase involved in cell wall biosynthesis